MQTQTHQIRLTHETRTTKHRLLARLVSPFFILSLLFSPTVFALAPINTTFFGNLAIEGYDPVAYFQQNKAVKGSKYFQSEWMGANWRFSSAENQALFRQNPKKYAPQYGGYCAYAVSQNDVAGIKPELFTIHEGKLYLNYNRSINQKWRENREQYIIDADQYWPQLLAK